MSIETQLRAMPESEIREDRAWEEFTGAAGESDRFQAVREAGIAAAVEHHFPALHTVYTTAYTPEDARTRALPVSGGAPVHHPTHDRPPFLILRPTRSARWRPC
ncbi:hypothetical protein ACWDX6_10590 [Streptomyces sp. NPDC003027]